MMYNNGRIDAGGIIAAAVAGFLLAIAITEGAATEGAHIMRGAEERIALATAATRAGVPVPPELIRMR